MQVHLEALITGFLCSVTIGYTLNYDIMKRKVHSSPYFRMHKLVNMLTANCQ